MAVFTSRDNHVLQLVEMYKGLLHAVENGSKDYCIEHAFFDLSNASVGTTYAQRNYYEWRPAASIHLVFSDSRLFYYTYK